MYLRKPTIKSTEDYSQKINRLSSLINDVDAMIIGAGAGMSVAAGLTYDGERFSRLFPDYIEKYGFEDMYTAGFYPYETVEEYWAYWSRYIFHNRFGRVPGTVYDDLLKLLAGKEYFVMTTNVDHCFQRKGFEKSRLFYTQGDYGLWQCSIPCHNKTYDNQKKVFRMISEQRDMKVPSYLIPHCPNCGEPMTMNLRSDDTFVEDEGWRNAQKNYIDFLNENSNRSVLYLEIGVGYNTPVIIKYPFIKMTVQNRKAHYVCMNRESFDIPDLVRDRSMMFECDVSSVFYDLKKIRGE